jgi:hypothetical protein
MAGCPPPYAAAQLNDGVTSRAQAAAGTPVAYAAIALSAARPGLRAHQLLSPEDGSKIAFATLLCRIERLATQYSPRHASGRTSPPRPGSVRPLNAPRPEHAAEQHASAIAVSGKL